MPKVLLIDDDPVVAGVYECIFSAVGFEVEVATDGEEGLAAVQRHKPDAVLLDLDMPKVNGLQWLEHVRRDARFKRLPVIVFTAATISWQISAARNADVTLVLSKKQTNPGKVVQAISDAVTDRNWRGWQTGIAA
jgi:CheY-like chemotaxis protein